MDEQIVSHKDLLDKIEAVEEENRKWFTRLIVFMIPLALSGFVWSWTAYAAQQGFNADINARVQGNIESYREARATQQRIEERLEQIQVFLREDSRELRDEVRSHKHQGH